MLNFFELNMRNILKNREKKREMNLIKAIKKTAVNTFSALTGGL